MHAVHHNANTNGNVDLRFSWWLIVWHLPVRQFASDTSQRDIATTFNSCDSSHCGVAQRYCSQLAETLRVHTERRWIYIPWLYMYVSRTVYGQTTGSSGGNQFSQTKLPQRQSGQHRTGDRWCYYYSVAKCPYLSVFARKFEAFPAVRKCTGSPRENRKIMISRWFCPRGIHVHVHVCTTVYVWCGVSPEMWPVRCISRPASERHRSHGTGHLTCWTPE